MFGGFGGLPRKGNQGANPELGVVQSGSPVRIITPATLGAVTANTPPPQRPLTPPSLGAQNQQSWPKGSIQPVARQAPGSPVQMNLPRAGVMKLSILIPTLSSRAAVLAGLIRKLEKQIAALGPQPEVEVLIFEDNKQQSVGAKRTKLILEAHGEYVVFVDDDDDIADDYVYQFVRAIKENPGVDCIGMRGVITTNGHDARQVVYSLKNVGLFEAGGVYYRPPSHLTPIRRAIASRYVYADSSFGEDSDWAVRVMKDKALKTEFFVDKVLYHYQFSPNNSETQNRFKATDKSFFHIVILSARAVNLRRCLNSIIENEPALPRHRIVVVDDGAGAECAGEYPGVTFIPGIKPFVFSRNANLGIQRAGSDVILLNDDARLMTKFGFSSQSFATRARRDVGVCSSAITGFVGNPRQKPGVVAAGMRQEQGTLAFISVYIPKEAISKVGLLDERFVGYGYEDNDYCLRVKKANFKLAIYDGCIVEHGHGSDTSTYRSKADVSALMEQNRLLYKAKWPNDA